MGDITWPAPATTYMVDLVWWLWQVLVNGCFQSGELDQTYLVKSTLPDEILKFVILSLFCELAFFNDIYLDLTTTCL